MVKRSFQKCSLFLFTLEFLISFIILTGLFVSSSSQKAKRDSVEQIGLFLSLESMDNRIISTRIIKQIVQLSNVIGVNQTCSTYITPCNFRNVKYYSGENPYLQSVQIPEDSKVTSESVVLSCNYSTNLCDEFRKGYARLLKGDWPSVDNPGLLISCELSKSNSVDIGDLLEFTHEGKQHAMTVVGIYEITCGFEICKDNAVGTVVFAYSPYNKIYADSQCIDRIWKDTPLRTLNIYVNHYDNLDTVEKELKETIDLEWDRFTLRNTTEERYRANARNVFNMVNSSKAFCEFSFPAGLIILFLFGLLASTDINHFVLFKGTNRKSAVVFGFLRVASICAIAYFVSFIVIQIIQSDVVELLNQYDPFDYLLLYSYKTGMELAPVFKSMPVWEIDLHFYGLFIILSTIAPLIVPVYDAMRPKQID